MEIDLLQNVILWWQSLQWRLQEFKKVSNAALQLGQEQICVESIL